MSYLIQLLLPLADNDGQPLPSEVHARVKAEISEKFGGLTAYTRSPAEGRWRDDGSEIRDEMVMYEVVTTGLNARWWRNYRHELMKRFRQDEVMIRALPIRRL